MIDNGTCDSAVAVKLERFPHLRSIKIGNKSFSLTTSFVVKYCPKLTSISVGKRSFMAEAATSGVIEISECSMLRSFEAGIFSFQKYNSIAFSSEVSFIMVI